MYEKYLFKQLLKQRLRFLYLMSLALLCNINLLSAEPDIIIESDQQPKILSEVLEELGNIYNVFFSYNSQQLNEVEVHFDFTPNEKIDDAINRLLEDSNYGFEAFGGKYYVVFAKTVKGKKNAKKIIEKIQEIQEIENEGDASIQLVRKNPARHLSSVSTSVSAIIMEEVIKGFVNGPDGEPLIGATLQLTSDKSIGTITNADGSFTISVPNMEDTIIVSYLGYQTALIPLSSTSMNIILELDSNVLDEVVVVGYGTLKKSDIVGSVTRVTVEEATTVPTTNIAEMLRGKAAGVQVNLADARPGGTSNILIRGKTSIAVGNDPLIIVDGLPFDNINDVVPEDVSSIEVLKDASATAIYGSRASNGVILITTKRGAEGKVAINYHGYTTTQSLSKNFDLYSPEEFAELRREALRTTNPDGGFFSDEVNFEPFEQDVLRSGNFVDWEDLVLEDALIQSHSLNVSAGNENTKIYAGAGYFDQDGLVPTSGFRRGSLRLNIDQKINEKLSIQGNVNFTSTDQDRETNSLNFITLSPLAVPFDENGELVRNPLGPSTTLFNPLWNIRESDHKVRSNVTDLNFVGKYDITPDFSYKFNGFMRRRSGDETIYRTRLHSSGDDGINGLGNLISTSGQEYQIENQVDYNYELNKDHIFNFTAVHSVSERETQLSGVTKSNYPNDDLGANGGAIEINGTDRDLTRRTLVSFMGRLRYSLLNKYLLTLTGRRDGASVFSENNKWAFFPSAALAWKIQNEPFLQNNEDINELKLRVSYGQTGNQGAPSTRTLGVADDLPYIFGGGSTSGGFLPLTRLPNPNLKWETNTTFNIGLDFGLFGNLLTGTLEYYNSDTEDLLLDRVLSGTSGFSVTTFNIGTVTNKGIEASLTTNIIRKKDLNWSVTAILSKNKNKITKLAGELDSEGNPVDFPSQGLFIGEPINNIFQVQFDGIFQTQAEIDASAQAMQTGIAPGNIRVVDQNEDGEITGEDNIVISEDPDWYGSLSSSFEYKGFELFADLFMVQGATKLNPYLAEFNLGGTLSGKLNGIKVPYWTPENPSTTFPRPNFDVADSFLFPLAVQDASYLRLRTLTLGYNIPSDTLEKIGITSAKIYATATNLLTITDYKSYSPELNPGAFPDAKAFTFGIKLGF